MTDVRALSRRDFLHGATAAGTLGALGAALPVTVSAADAVSGVVTQTVTGAAVTGPLSLVSGAQPRAFWFRSLAEAEAGVLTYPTTWGGLDGVMVKALNEETPEPHRLLRAAVKNLKGFSGTQAALLHFNGHGRLPTDGPSPFFAGHWIHREGTRLTEALSPTATVVRVSNRKPFTMTNGYANCDPTGTCGPGEPDDIVIVPTKVGGGLDWAGAEQVRLTTQGGSDTRGQFIEVARGQYGTTPRQFPAGSLVAPHLNLFLWLGPGQPALHQWFYNFAATCPRDGANRSATDVLVDELVGWFTGTSTEVPRIDLSTWDGVEFDQFRYYLAPSSVVDPETPKAGVYFARDGGIVGGTNAYGAGATAFLDRLQVALGGRLVMADTGSNNGRPSFLALNGTEAEGWPSQDDATLQDWSSGLNRLDFWQRNARGRASTDRRLSYLVLKFGGSPAPDQLRRRVRMSCAAAALTDTAVAQMPTSTNPDPWDELVGGRGGPGVHWLGPAAGPARHLAAQRSRSLVGTSPASWLGAPTTGIQPPRPTLFGCAASFPDTLTLRLTEQDAPAVADWQHPAPAGTSVAPFPPLLGPTATQFGFRLPEVDLGPSTDLYLQFGITCGGGKGSPEDGLARLVTVRVEWLSAGALRTVMSYTWANQSPRVATFSFRGLSGRVDVTVTVEGTGPAPVGGFTGHASVTDLVMTPLADVVYREFAHGLVLANPGAADRTLDLTGLDFGLTLGTTLSYLQASPGQATTINTGGRVAATRVRLPAADALFLRR